MKYVFGVLGILFIFVGNYFPLPDPGLGQAFFICGACLLLCALSTEIVPILDQMIAENEFAGYHPPEKIDVAPAPGASTAPEVQA